MFRELSGPMLAEEYVHSGQPLANSQLDEPLTPRDVTQIWLTDGGSKGSQLVFSAAEGNVMETRWPPALRSINRPLTARPPDFIPLPL